MVGFKINFHYIGQEDIPRSFLIQMDNSNMTHEEFTDAVNTRVKNALNDQPEFVISYIEPVHIC